MGRARHLSLLFVSTASLALGQISIQELKIEGNQRLPASGIAAASGLRLKSTVSAADLNAAVQTLASSGLFTSVTFKYGPSGPGSVVTLSVVEAKATAKVILDIPGLDGAAFWTAMAGTLIDRVMPPNPDADAYYSKGIQDYLARVNHPDEITELDETDLATHSMTSVFQSAHRPVVAELQFTGSRAISAKALQDLTSRLIVGNPYSERDDKTILEANLRPVYEEKGYLKVALPSLTTEKTSDGKLIVTAAVEEGRIWNIGAVAPAGDGVDPGALLTVANLHTGELANGKAIAEGVDRMLNEYRKTGYIAARAATSRVFHDESGTVDLNVQINRGQMFRFGRLELTGLSDSDRAKAEGMWKLQPGSPMNSLYVNDYLKAVLQEVKPAIKSVSPQMKTSGDSVNVTIAFTPK